MTLQSSVDKTCADFDKTLNYKCPAAVTEESINKFCLLENGERDKSDQEVPLA